MMNFLTRSYHWIILGVATLAALITAALLIPRLLALHDTFTSIAAVTKSTKAPALQPSPNALQALDNLQKPIFWKRRIDGASPWISRPYILKNGMLIDPMEGTEPLYPPVPNKWLIDHKLDYTDLNILDRDPTHKGFTIKEEFLAGTDPNDPNQFPPLYSKLSYSDQDIRKAVYTLEFLDVEDTESGKSFELRPLQPLPNPAKGNRPDKSSRTVPLGSIIPGAPFLRVINYQDKKKMINDTEYDVSEITLENSLTGEHYTLVKKYGSREYRPHSLEQIESVTFHYQLTGVPEEIITVQRGKEFSLTSLDKKFTETYKLDDFSAQGVLLEKNGKTFALKPIVTTTAPTP
jgi:hypothetical protein